MTNIYFDVGAIPVGGGNPFKEEFYWPVSNAEYKNLYETILDHYFKLLIELPRKNSDIIFSDSAFIYFLIQFCHYQSAQYKAEHLGYTCKSSTLTEHHLNPDWEVIASAYSHLLSKFTLADSIILQPLKRTARNLVHFRSGICTQTISAPKFPQHNVAFGVYGSTNQIQQHYFSQSSHYWHYWDWYDYMGLLNTKNNLITRVSQFTSNLQQDFVVEIIRLVASYMLTLGIKIDVLSIENAWNKRLIDVACLYENIYNIDRLPSQLAVLSENDFRRKPIILALQRRGVTTTGFLHGDTLSGVYNQRYGTSLTRSHVGTYITPSKNNALLHSEMYSTPDTYNHVETTYTSHNVPFYEASQPNQCLKQKRLKVLLIGYPMNITRYLDDESLFFYPKLELELRIIEVLESHNIPISYKPHPDRLEYIPNLYTKLGVQIVHEPFNMVLDSYTTLIFSHPTTSLFGHVLKTNKNMILIDSAANLWNDMAFEKLQKRCHILNCHTNQNTRIEFVEAQLIDAIHSILDGDSRRLDREFCEYYFAQ